MPCESAEDYRVFETYLYMQERGIERVKSVYAKNRIFELFALNQWSFRAQAYDAYLDQERVKQFEEMRRWQAQRDYLRAKKRDLRERVEIKHLENALAAAESPGYQSLYNPRDIAAALKKEEREEEIDRPEPAKQDLRDWTEDELEIIRRRVASGE